MKKIVVINTLQLLVDYPNFLKYVSNPASLTQHNAIGIKYKTCLYKSVDGVLGIRTAEWQAQTNPLCYTGTLPKLLFMIQYKFLTAVHESIYKFHAWAYLVVKLKSLKNKFIVPYGLHPKKITFLFYLSPHYCVTDPIVLSSLV